MGIAEIHISHVVPTSGSAAGGRAAGWRQGRVMCKVGRGVLVLKLSETFYLNGLSLSQECFVHM